VFEMQLVHDNDLMFLVPNMDGIPQASRTLKMWMGSDEFVHCPMLQWILEEARGTLPLLGNLRTLILDNCEAGDKIQVLWCFLHNAPVLETLTLNNCKVYILLLTFDLPYSSILSLQALLSLSADFLKFV
jgi:hypothetical protein